MAQGDGYDVRHEMLQLLMTKVADDLYPSSTMLDMIEELLTPDDVPAYAAMLMEKIGSEIYPSISMMNRVRDLVA